jgi:hypothetical protein
MIREDQIINLFGIFGVVKIILLLGDMGVPIQESSMIGLL